MKKQKIVLSLFLVLLLGMMSFTYAGERQLSEVTVNRGRDYSNHWANSDIQYLMDRKVLSGYPNGTFKPNNDVTRAEFVKMINESLGLTLAADLNFSDIEKSNWFYNHVAIGVGEGYIEGYDDGTFQPNRNISRQEVATIISRVMGLEIPEESNNEFLDGDEIKEFAKLAVNAAVDGGYMEGFPDGTFKPLNNLTRGQAARVTNNLLGIKTKARFAQKPIITWVDDDGNKGFYTKLKPFAEEFGIPFTSAIITNRGFGGRYMTLEQMQEMADLGCEFVSHMHTHNTNRWPAHMTAKELHYEFSTSKQIIKDLGFNHKIVVYPFGSENQLVRNIASQYYDIGIDTYNSNIPLGNIVTKPFNRYRIERVNAQYDDINEIYGKMDEAVRKNSWIILVSHMDQGNWYSEERVRNLIEYALGAGLEFVTLEEGYNIMK